MIARLAWGCGYSIIWATAPPLLMSLFLKYPGLVCSWVNMSLCLGAVFGAPSGGLLYSKGGYTFPFWVVGLAQLFISLICFLGIPKNAGSQIFDTSNVVLGLKSVRALLTNSGVLSICCTLTFVCSIMGFISLELAPHLTNKYKIDIAETGKYFLAFTVASTLSSAVLGVLIDRGSAGVIFCFPGFMLIALSMFSISRLGSVSNQSISLIIFEILIAMSGIGVYSVTNSSIPILRRLVSSHEDIPIVLIDTYATLTYTLCTGVGVSLGQILVGGLICGRFGFENGCLAIAIASAMSGAVTMVTLTKKGILFGTQNHLVYELDLDISEDGDSISA